MRIEGADRILVNLSRIEDSMRVGVNTAAMEIAFLLEAYAKTHHPWVRDTGATDNSTRGFIETVTPDLVNIVLSAGTDYAQYLELSHGERYKWLRPAVDECQSAMIDIIYRRLGV